MSQTPRVQRSALLVDDLERSLMLYRDVLGFEVAFIKNSDSESYSYPAFNIPRSATIRFATLNAGALQPRALGLIEIKGVDWRAPLPDTRTSALVVEVANVESIATRLRELSGVTVLAAGPLATQDGRNGQELAVWDADGHVIVLYHIDS